MTDMAVLGMGLSGCLCKCLLFCCVGVRQRPRHIPATSGPIVPATDDRWVWTSWWNENWQGKPKYSEKTCPNAVSFTTNPTRRDLGRRGGWNHAINRLSYGIRAYLVAVFVVCSKSPWLLVVQLKKIRPHYRNATVFLNWCAATWT
jgi:hypothetical protein